MTNNQKLKALNHLKSLSTPISLHELQHALGAGYTERTLRRWLAEWAQLGLVIKSGHKRSTQYQAVDTNATTSTFQFSAASQKAINHIKRPYALRKPVTYQVAWLENYEPNITSYLSTSLKKQLMLAGDRSNHLKPAGTYAKQIYFRLLLDLSYNSSRLEGNTYSLLETKRLIMEGIDTPGKLNEEKTMILNHKEAINYLVSHSRDFNIEIATICTLHYLLSEGLVSANYSGQLRDHGVRISGSSYIPLENQDDLKHILKLICHKANHITHPHEKSIFLLTHIAYLQAFIDVNKRTARLSANIPLIMNNLTPLSFEGISQTNYTDAMISIYELNDIHPLVDLYVHSYLHTAALYDVTVDAIGFDRIRVQYREQRRALVRHIIIHLLHGATLKHYAEKEIAKFADVNDRAFVLKNLEDDLDQLGPQSIVGLGVTQAECDRWLKQRN